MASRWIARTGWITAALAVAGLTAWAWYRYTRPVVESVIVMPLSVDSHEMDSIAAGMTEEIRAELQRVPKLRVLTSGKASATITGRARRDGVVLRMLNKDYEVVAPWPEVAAKAVEALGFVVPPPAVGSTPPRMPSSEAFVLFLRGRQEGSADVLSQAIAKDPTFARAHAALAEVWLRKAVDEDGAFFEKAGASARRAIELDAGLGAAHTTLGEVLSLGDWNWAAAEAELKKGVELGPRSAHAFDAYGEWLATRGKFGDAAAAYAKALALDPGAAEIVMHSGDPFYFQGQYDEAMERYRRALELKPGMAEPHVRIMSALACKGDPVAAVAEAVVALEDGGEEDRAADLSDWLDERGWRRALQLFFVDSEEDPAEFLARLAAIRGDRERCLRSLEEAVEEHAVELATVGVDPIYAFVREDPRFREVMKQVGF